MNTDATGRIYKADDPSEEGGEANSKHAGTKNDTIRTRNGADQKSRNKRDRDNLESLFRSHQGRGRCQDSGRSLPGTCGETRRRRNQTPTRTSLCRLSSESRFFSTLHLRKHRCVEPDTDRNGEPLPDGGESLPESIDDFLQEARRRDRLKCRECGDLVDRRYLVDRLCPGCRHAPGDGQLVTDGGGPTGPDPSRAHYPTHEVHHEADRDTTPGAFLGPHRHRCDICGGEFSDLSTLADHDCAGGEP